LIIALWTLSFLAVLAVVLSFYARQKTTLVRRLDERDKLNLIAEAGARKAIMQIVKRNEKYGQRYFALNDLLRYSPQQFNDIRMGDGQYNIVYKVYSEESGPQVRWGVVDEESKLNINRFAIPELTRLFQIVLKIEDTDAKELAAAVIDWRDKDSGLSIPMGSAEDFHYKGMSHPYEAKDAPFESLDEVLLVKDMTTKKLELLKDYITIYGEDKVNINTASKPVLLALGLGLDMTNKIIFFRSGDDGVEGTDDDNIFVSESQVVPKLTQMYSLNEVKKEWLSGVVERFIKCDSEYFTIYSLANLKNKEYARGVTCTVDYEGKILYWRRDN